MKQHIKNMIFISICEGAIIYFRKNKGKKSFNMTNFDKWCNYATNFIIRDMKSPTLVMEFQIEILNYVEEIYGFNDNEIYPLILEFFKTKKWVELYEIADCTLYIQEHKRFP